MRRNALCLSVSLFLMLPMSGCATVHKLFAKKPPAPAPSALGSADLYVPSTAAETRPAPEHNINVPVVAPRVAEEPTMPQVVAADPTTGVALRARTSTGSRMHTVARKETLYSLAREYYGDQARWKDIYEANRSSLRDPNKIYVGQRLAIP